MQDTSPQQRSNGDDANGSGVQADQSDLKRGVIVNALGYLPKLAVPVLLVLVIRAYGAFDFGLFTFAQAVLLLVCRIALLGLDKALLWWTPQQASDRALIGFGETFTATSIVSVLVTFLTGFVLAPQFAEWGEMPQATLTLRIMSLSLWPMVAMELFLASSMGLKRMEPNVLIKETLLPVLNVGLALLFYSIGLHATGLALSFVSAYTCCALISFLWWKRLHQHKGSITRLALPPRPIINYSLPIWLTDIANSFQQRMDTYFITGFLDLRSLGIYAAVVQIANSIRSIRRSFDPIVLVIAADIGSKSAADRLRNCYSYATYLVTATQLPVLAFIIVFAQWIMPLFGEGFEAGTTAVIVLCSFWVLTSPFSLAGIVVSAYGYSNLGLLNVIIGILFQGFFLWWLVPKYTLDGAALAVGLGYCVVSIVQLLQMKWVTKQWNYEPRVLFPALLSATVFGLVYACWRLLELPSNLVTRTVAFAVALAIYGAGLYQNSRKRLS